MVGIWEDSVELNKARCPWLLRQRGGSKEVKETRAEPCGQSSQTNPRAMPLKKEGKQANGPEMRRESKATSFLTWMASKAGLAKPGRRSEQLNSTGAKHKGAMAQL